MAVFKQLAFKQKDFQFIDLKMYQQLLQTYKIGYERYVQSLHEAITGEVVVNQATNLNMLPELVC